MIGKLTESISQLFIMKKIGANNTLYSFKI